MNDIIKKQLSSKQNQAEIDTDLTVLSTVREGLLRTTSSASDLRFYSCPVMSEEGHKHDQKSRA